MKTLLFWAAVLLILVAIAVSSYRVDESEGSCCGHTHAPQKPCPAPAK